MSIVALWIYLGIVNACAIGLFVFTIVNHIQVMKIIRKSRDSYSLNNVVFYGKI